MSTLTPKLVNKTRPKINSVASLEILLWTNKTVLEIQSDLEDMDSYAGNALRPLTREQIVQVIFDIAQSRSSAKQIIEKLAEVGENLAFYADSDDFYFDHLISCNSYCDSDLGYNTITEVEMSDYYNSIMELAEKLQGLDYDGF